MKKILGQPLDAIDVIIIAAHLSAILSLILASLYFLIKSRGKASREKIYMVGIALFFIMNASARFMMFYSELQMDPFVWRLTTYESNRILEANSQLYNLYQILYYISSAIAAFAVTILLFVLEREILEGKTKYIITLIQIILAILSLILGASPVAELTIGKILLYAGSFSALAVPLIYFYFAYKTTGETRIHSAGAGIGMIVLFLGIVADTFFVKTLFQDVAGLGVLGVWIAYILHGIFLPIGLIIYVKSIKY